MRQLKGFGIGGGVEDVYQAQRRRALEGVLQKREIFKESGEKGWWEQRMRLEWRGHGRSRCLWERDPKGGFEVERGNLYSCQRPDEVS